MATLRNKRKLAAVSREAPEGSSSSRGRNILDPELTQDYISQVSEEIKGRVTKKLSKEFNKTESRILGALSKLDEFLLNPQVRTCSVTARGTSRHSNLENRETHGDRSSNDPYPEGGYFPHLSGQLNSSEEDMVTETFPHMVTGDRSHRRNLSQPSHDDSNSRRGSLLLPYYFVRQTEEGALHKSTNFAVRIPQRQLEQTRFCLPFNNWRRTPIQPISIIILAESRNCLNPSQRQCLRLMGNQRNSNCLKIYSKRV